MKTQNRRAYLMNDFSALAEVLIYIHQLFAAVSHANLRAAAGSCRNKDVVLIV